MPHKGLLCMYEMKGIKISLKDVKVERNGEEMMRVFRLKGKGSLFSKM